MRSHCIVRAGSVSNGLFLLLALIAAAVPALAEDQPSETVTKKNERYLGVVTEPISDAMAAQLKAALPDGRGLLVKRVLPDSPAAKAGLEPFDIVFRADAKGVATSEELKTAVSAQAAGQSLKLQFLRGAKVQTVDVLPGERMVSRMIVRHKESDDGEEVSAQRKRESPAPSEPYAVSVQTKNGRDFRVEVRLGADESKTTRHEFTGDAAEIAKRMKSLPEPVQKSLTRQVAQLSEERTSPRSVQFRVRPQRQGNRQVLVVSLRQPETGGAERSLELQQPLAETAAAIPLKQLLDHPDLTATLKSLDPAVRTQIEAMLKTASLPASTLKVEESQ